MKRLTTEEDEMGGFLIRGNGELLNEWRKKEMAKLTVHLQAEPNSS